MGRDCRFRIVEASRNADGEALLSERDAANLIEEIKAAAEKKSKQGIDIEDAIIDELAERKIRAREESELQKRNAMKNLIVRNTITTRANEYIAEGLSVRKSLQAILVGVQGRYNKGRASVDNKIKTLTNQYLGEFEKEIEAAGLLRLLNEKTHGLAIEQELFELRKGEKGKPNISGSKEAKQVADIFFKYSEALRKRANRAGAKISVLDDYSISQTHDRIQMRKDGYESWRDFVAPMVDKSRIPDDADMDGFLRSVYEVLTTGVTKKDKESDNLFEFVGPYNLAKKISRERVLHFKSAEDAYAYRQKYGVGSISDGLAQHITTATRNIGLLEELGTNPKAMLDTIVKELNRQHRGNEKAVAMPKDISAINNFMSELDLTTHIPENPKLAKIGSFLRMLESMASLGMATLSAITDLPVKAIEMQGFGKGAFSSYSTSVADLFKAVGGNNADRLAVARAIRAGSEAMSGSVIAKFSSTDDLPGMMSKLQRQFFKLNLMTWWNDANKDGTAIALSNFLASRKTRNYADLDEDILRHFNNFDITEQDWNLIKQTATKQGELEYITPDAIRGLDDSFFGKGAQRKKEQLEDKLRGFYLDIIDHATITPDAREQAIMTQGLKRGTPLGETLRFIMQFKSFPITVMTKLYGRGLYAKGKADIPMLVQSTIAMTALGYVAMSAKDIVKGREPRPLNDPKTFAAAYLQGGGGGIMGDYIFGEYNRFGQTVTTTLAGPMFGNLDELGRIFMEAKSLEGQDTAAKSIEFITRNSPFNNLFYVRPVLDHMFLYQLQEAMNSGYLRRMERRVEKENNQKFFIKPSDAVR